MPKQMGVLIVDHRASPGLTQAEALAAGYDPAFCGEGKLYEVDTLSCSHCSARVVPNIMRTRPRALCMECDNRSGHYICDGCDYLRRQSGYVHKPYVAQIEEHLTKVINNSILLKG
jgi:hypothetical protein